MTAGLLGRWLEALVVVAIGTVMVWILWPGIQAFRVQPAARRELVAFTSELRLGMTRTAVQTHFGKNPRAFLSLTHVDASLTIVETPYTPGAGNWRGWLDFTGDRLASVRIRTMDGEHITPTGSPPDVGVAPSR
jgi:hypothetical protein